MEQKHKAEQEHKCVKLVKVPLPFRQPRHRLSYENVEYRVACSCGWAEKAMTERNAVDRFQRHF